MRFYTIPSDLDKLDYDMEEQVENAKQASLSIDYKVNLAKQNGASDAIIKTILDLKDLYEDLAALCFLIDKGSKKVDVIIAQLLNKETIDKEGEKCTNDMDKHV